jgi:hypothetical protein
MTKLGFIPAQAGSCFGFEINDPLLGIEHLVARLGDR